MSHNGAILVMPPDAFRPFNTALRSLANLGLFFNNYQAWLQPRATNSLEAASSQSR